MSFPTVQKIIQDTIVMMGQVGGSSVQTYTEPLAMIGINRIFEQLFFKYPWDHLWSWQQGTLDGVTGKIAGSLSGVVSYMDITEIRTSNTEIDIPSPNRTEHLTVNGSVPLYRTPLMYNDADYDTKFFKFWPVTAMGDIDFLCGTRPAEFETGNDVVPMEKSLMVNGLTWWMLADDGMNPASAEKAQVMFDTGYQDIIARLGSKKIGYGSTGRNNGRTVLIRPT